MKIFSSFLAFNQNALHCGRASLSADQNALHCDQNALCSGAQSSKKHMVAAQD